MKDKSSCKLRVRENVHINHRSRLKNKFIDNGFSTFLEHEMLELLLFFSIPQADTNPTAHRLIEKFGSLKGVFDAPIDTLMTIDGIGTNSAILIKLLPSLMHEYLKQENREQLFIENQLQAKSYVEKLFSGVSLESFYVICLNAKSEIVDTKEMNSGTASKVDVQIRQITDYILKQNCDRIIITHNHPTGEKEPSNDDIRMTQKLFNSCVLNDIDILDHIIYSPSGIYSFAENGLMNQIKQSILNMLKLTIDKDQFMKFSTSVKEYLITK